MGSGLGVALGAMRRKRLEGLVHLAAGALMAITLFDMLPEAKSTLDWPGFLSISALGFLLLWAVSRYIYPVCPACALGGETHETPKMAGRVVALMAGALAVHCSLDGLSLAMATKASIHVQAGILGGISIHKLPEGLALALLLAGAGFSKRANLLWCLGIESFTFLGGLAAVGFLRGANGASVGACLAFVGGGFLYLVSSVLAGARGHRTVVPLRLGLALQGGSFAITGAALLASGQVFR